ncbi:hypothetical protein PR048_032736 [Dryococelus australis]|uniref:Uncharacterized protein n=1 Tax=Dryococelus australis TaxID=614101 RepID=A0ABQ9G326_9NEOP|nr:hypothetical protein PR048_032736 [Dryococelus australis]
MPPGWTLPSYVQICRCQQHIGRLLSNSGRPYLNTVLQQVSITVWTNGGVERKMRGWVSVSPHPLPGEKKRGLWGGAEATYIEMGVSRNVTNGEAMRSTQRRQIWLVVWRRGDGIIHPKLNYISASPWPSLHAGAKSGFESEQNFPRRSRLLRRRTEMREVLGLNPSVGMKGGGGREIPEETHRPTASSGTIPTCEIAMGGERADRSATVAPWWKAGILTARPRGGRRPTLTRIALSPRATASGECVFVKVAVRELENCGDRPVVELRRVVTSRALRHV